jgi:heme-degrading monooxygenase HmoA
MSVVKINAIEVPEGMGSMLEERFAKRAGEVEQMPGFEEFELLRPKEGETRYFVYTRWESEEAFQAWVNSEQFTRGHAQSSQAHGGPVATHSSLLGFEVVQRVVKAPA